MVFYNFSIAWLILTKSHVCYFCSIIRILTFSLLYCSELRPYENAITCLSALFTAIRCPMHLSSPFKHCLALSISSLPMTPIKQGGHGAPAAAVFRVVAFQATPTNHGGWYGRSTSGNVDHWPRRCLCPHWQWRGFAGPAPTRLLSAFPALLLPLGR